MIVRKAKSHSTNSTKAAVGFVGFTLFLHNSIGKIQRQTAELMKYKEHHSSTSHRY